MKVGQLFERLMRDFPEDSICVTADYWVHRGTEGEPHSCDARLAVHCASRDGVPCHTVYVETLEEGIRMMRKHLDPTDPTISHEADSLVSTDADEFETADEGNTSAVLAEAS